MSHAPPKCGKTRFTSVSRGLSPSAWFPFWENRSDLFSQNGPLVAGFTSRRRPWRRGGRARRQGVVRKCRDRGNHCTSSNQYLLSLAVFRIFRKQGLTLSSEYSEHFRRPRSDLPVRQRTAGRRVRQNQLPPRPADETPVGVARQHFVACSGSPNGLLVVDQREDLTR